MAKISYRRAAQHLSELLFGYISSFRESIHIAFVDNRDDGASDRRRILYGNIFANMTAVMTGGVFFTGLILILLRDESQTVRDSYVGTVTGLQTACGMLQILAPIIVERMKIRKYFVMLLRIVYYFINVIGFAAVPLLPLSSRTNATIFLVLVVIMQASHSLSAPALSVWHLGSLPDNRRTDYYSIQSLAIPVINAVLSIVCGLFIDHFKAGNAELTGILLVRGVVIALVIAETRCFWNIKEPVYAQSPAGMSLRSILSAPFRSRGFLLLTVIAIAWNFCNSIAGQYFNVYLLEDVKMSYTYFNLASIFNIPILVLMMPVWIRIIKRIGSLPSMVITVSVFAFTQLGNVFISERTPWMYIVACLVCSFISPGNSVLFANLPMFRLEGTEHMDEA
ncbi:MAG: MFS transporter, partial [Clostridia bacterium]|nr:MFS transporter [Clostridia bacterium]